MFWPWMPPCWGGTRSSMDLAGAAWLPALCLCCAAWPAAPPLKASADRPSRAPATKSVDLGIVVLPVLGARLQLLLPADLVALFPARGREWRPRALERCSVRPVAAVDGLGLLGARGQSRHCRDEDQEVLHDLAPPGWPACFEPYAVPQPQTSAPLPRLSTRLRKISAITSPSPPSSALVEHISAQAGSLPSARRLRPYLSNSASEPLASGPPAQNVHLSILPRTPKCPEAGNCGAPNGQA